MSQAFIRCPETGRDVYVGLNLEWADLDALGLGEQDVKCPACGATHSWNKDDLVLRADGGGD